VKISACRFSAIDSIHANGGSTRQQGDRGGDPAQRQCTRNSTGAICRSVSARTAAKATMVIALAWPAF